MSKSIEIVSICIDKLKGIVTVELTIDGTHEKITTHYSDNVIQYLSDDRVDAVVMGLLFFAIKNGYDISSSLPISAELKYKIENHLIPALIVNEGYHLVKLDMPIVDTYNKKGSIVATGISCGVDSLYTVATHQRNECSKYKLTHLTFFDVGSHRRGNDRNRSEQLFNGRLALAKKFCQEFNYELIIVQSDIHEIINKYEIKEYSHLEYDTYMMLFCTLFIQNGLKSYMCSSSNTYDNFSCIKSPKKEWFGCDNYELLLLTMSSVNEVEYISAGGSIKRLDKIKYLIDYEPSYRYLNVCVEEVHNDSTCPKCVRTLLALDAFGALDKYEKVFDISHYRQCRRTHMYDMYIEGKYKHWKIVQELFPMFKREFNLKFKIDLFFYRLKKSMNYRYNHLKGRV